MCIGKLDSERVNRRFCGSIILGLQYKLHGSLTTYSAPKLQNTVVVCGLDTSIMNTYTYRFFLENKFRRGELRLSNTKRGRTLSQAVD